MFALIGFLSAVLDWFAHIITGSQSVFDGFTTSLSTITATVASVVGVTPSFVTTFAYAVLTLAAAALFIKIFPFIG